MHHDTDDQCICTEDDHRKMPGGEKMGSQPGIILYRLEYANIRNKLTQSQKGDLLDALMDYSETGEEYRGEDPAVCIAFSFCSASIRKAEQRYRHRCQVNAENGRKRWTKERETAEADESDCLPADTAGCEREGTNANQNKPNININQNKNQNKTKRRRNIYIPPTPDEVAAYCRERGNAVDPERFVDFYTARGWELKPGQKMKDWRAAVRTWEKNQREWKEHELRGNEKSNRVRGQRELYGL